MKLSGTVFYCLQATRAMTLKYRYLWVYFYIIKVHIIPWANIRYVSGLKSSSVEIEFCPLMVRRLESRIHIYSRDLGLFRLFCQSIHEDILLMQRHTKVAYFTFCIWARYFGVCRVKRGLLSSGRLFPQSDLLPSGWEWTWKEAWKAFVWLPFYNTGLVSHLMSWLLFQD